MRLKRYHGLPAATVGLIMREAVRRGMGEIRNKLASFEVQEKPSEYKLEDQVTDADYAAQRAMKKVLEENMPWAGIIAEESGLKKECAHKTQQLIFTIDPLDGTRAFVRKQSDGIGCMLALVERKINRRNGEITEEVISVCIGDIMTLEMYYYRPESPVVHRIHKDRRDKMNYAVKSHRRLLMLDDLRLFPPFFSELSHPKDGYFQSIAIANGSIGTNMARLWKGEVEAVLLQKTHVTPWDLTPVWGVSNKLGFKFIRLEQIDDHPIQWLDIHTNPLQVVYMPITLVIHKSQIKKMRAWMKKKGISCVEWQEETK